MLTRKIMHALVFALALLMLTACGTTQKTNFYTLSAVAPVGNGKLSGQAIVIGIGPVEVAPYLERNQIVRRTGQTRLELAEYDRWAEPLENNIASVLAVNLSRQLPSIQAVIRPWSDANVKYQVVVKVQQFDSDVDGNVTLKASWGIQLNNDHSMPVIRTSTIEQASSGMDYESIMNTMSQALAELSDEIAEELSSTLSTGTAE